MRVSYLAIWKVTIYMLNLNSIKLACTWQSFDDIPTTHLILLWINNNNSLALCELQFHNNQLSIMKMAPDTRWTRTMQGWSDLYCLPYGCVQGAWVHIDHLFLLFLWSFWIWGTFGSLEKGDRAGMNGLTPLLR